MSESLIRDIVHFVKSFAELSPETKAGEHAAWLIKKWEKDQAAEKREDTLRIEVSFPVPVYVNDASFHRLVTVIDEICKDYERKHIGRVMWAAGMRSKITYMPMTKEEENAGRHIEFDPQVLCVEVAERADYDWPCKKCNHTQGDHKEHILQPPAGDCDFEPQPTKPKRGRDNHEESKGETS